MGVHPNSSFNSSGDFLFSAPRNQDPKADDNKRNYRLARCDADLTLDLKDSIGWMDATKEKRALAEENRRLREQLKELTNNASSTERIGMEKTSEESRHHLARDEAGRCLTECR